MSALRNSIFSSLPSWSPFDFLANAEVRVAAAADQLNHAAQGRDIDGAVIALRVAQTRPVFVAIRCSIMLRITIYVTLIVTLTICSASAQYDAWRTEREKKNDRAVDRAYQSTMKRLPNAEKKKSDPWADVRPAPPAAAKNKQ
jgi:hypothetical protein